MDVDLGIREDAGDAGDLIRLVLGKDGE